jgi:hypothetical protein
MKSSRRGHCALPPDLLRVSPPLAKGGLGGVVCLQLAQACEDSRGARRHPPVSPDRDVYPTLPSPWKRGGICPPPSQGGERNREARRNKTSSEVGLFPVRHVGPFNNPPSPPTSCGDLSLRVRGPRATGGFLHHGTSVFFQSPCPGMPAPRMSSSSGGASRRITRTHAISRPPPGPRARTCSFVPGPTDRRHRNGPRAVRSKL